MQCTNLHYLMPLDTHQRKYIVHRVNHKLEISNTRLQ